MAGQFSARPPDVEAQIRRPVPVGLISCHRMNKEGIMSLAGKTIFITGASRGIGLAIALRCARDGANIAIAAKSGTEDPRLPGTIASAAAQIEQAGGKALPIACDIRFEDQVLA